MISHDILDKGDDSLIIKIGHGYDVHRLVKGRKLVLGGVCIKHSKGLLGHSDADVLVHAIMDALLGACGLGDIGRHFPDSDAAYEGVSSLILLKRVGVLMKVNGFSIHNIDATIIAQAPKLSPYIESMKANISDALSLPECDINIKATTEEGLGFTGKNKGIAAHAVCLVEKF